MVEMGLSRPVCTKRNATVSGLRCSESEPLRCSQLRAQNVPFQNAQFSCFVSANSSIMCDSYQWVLSALEQHPRYQQPVSGAPFPEREIQRIEADTRK